MFGQRPHSVFSSGALLREREIDILTYFYTFIYIYIYIDVNMYSVVDIAKHLHSGPSSRCKASESHPGMGQYQALQDR